MLRSTTTFNILITDESAIQTLISWLESFGLVFCSSAVNYDYCDAGAIWVNELYVYSHTKDHYDQPYADKYRIAHKSAVGSGTSLNSWPGGHTETYSWPSQHQQLKVALRVAFDPLYTAELKMQQEIFGKVDL